jgi:hypothetical protein
MICHKSHMASSICLRATIFQNPEGTLWTHCAPAKCISCLGRVISLRRYC